MKHENDSLPLHPLKVGLEATPDQPTCCLSHENQLTFLGLFGKLYIQQYEPNSSKLSDTCTVWPSLADYNNRADVALEFVAVSEAVADYYTPVFTRSGVNLTIATLYTPALLG